MEGSVKIHSMDMILLHLIPAALYLTLALHFWRQCWHTPVLHAGGTGCVSVGSRILLSAALLLHGAGLFSALFPGDGMRFGFGEALSMMIWLAICFYWIETLYARLDGLHAIVMPAGFIGCLLPWLFPGKHLLVNAGSPAFKAHFIIAMLAYSLFTLAALHAMLMAVADRQLHHARFSRALASLPPLLTMEAMLFRLIAIAFVFLTLTLLTGMVFSESLFGTAFRLDHKSVFAMVSWLTFGILLAGRHFRGWRGRLALRWTLSGFGILLLAYVGSRFVLEVLLARPN